MKILILNDLHIGDSRESTTNPGVIRQANSEAVPTLMRVIEKVKNNKFDLVVQLGDLIRDEYIEEKDVQNLKLALNTLSKLPFETIHLLGNHELSALSRERIEGVYQEIGIQPKFFGYKEFPDIQIAWLDFVLDEQKHGYLPQEKIEWLKSVVKTEKPILLFSHYGFLPQNPTGSFYFEKDPKGLSFINGQESWNQIHNLPIVAVVNGHVHWASYSKVDHSNMITVPAFTENVASSDPHNNPGIYSILEIDDKKLCLKSFSGDYCFLNIEV